MTVPVATVEPLVISEDMYVQTSNILVNLPTSVFLVLLSFHMHARFLL